MIAPRKPELHLHTARLATRQVVLLEQRLAKCADEADGQDRLPYLQAAIWIRRTPGFEDSDRAPDYLDLFATEAIWRSLRKFCKKHRLVQLAEDIRVAMPDVFNGT